MGDTEHVVLCPARSEAHQYATLVPVGSSQRVGGEPQQGMGCPIGCCGLGGSVSPLQEETTALG